MTSNLEDTSLLATLADVDPSTVTNALEKLQMLAEPINGPNSFNLETAAYGYITREERLVIPLSLKDKIPTNIGDAVNLNIIELSSIMMYNYLRMKKRSLTDDHAVFIAAYRARLIQLGYLLRNKEDRHVTVDEVDYPRQAKNHHQIDYAGSPDYKKAFDEADSDAEQYAAMMTYGSDDHFKKFLGFLTQKTDITTYITMASTQLAASTYLVFRQMGHHYKSELEGKYNVLWKATTLERPNFVPSNSEIHRSAIHSFGVYSLHEMFFRNNDGGLLSETYTERSDVTPCGVAVIKTCWASISLMQSLPIWGSLYRAYKEQIDALKEQASKLNDARGAIKYHKNARLFGQTRAYLDPAAAYALSPVAKGFLESMSVEADIKKQKALDKRASQNPVAVAMIANVIIGIMDRITTSGDLARALPSSEQPQVEEVK
jgi:hypothetical protein